MQKRAVILFIICLTAILSSCCVSQKTAERKISRLVECNPSLKESKPDTVRVTLRDTILIEGTQIIHDTILKLDTVRFERDGINVTLLRGRTNTPCDTVEVPIEVTVDCPDKEVPVELEGEVITESDQINVTDRRGGGFFSRLMNQLEGFVIGFLVGGFLVLIVRTRL